jgi:hypothetical protein
MQNRCVEIINPMTATGLRHGMERNLEVLDLYLRHETTIDDKPMIRLIFRNSRINQFLHWH